MSKAEEHVLSRKKAIFGSHSVRERLQPTWHTALSFYEGNHWKKWNQLKGRLVDIKPKSFKRKLTVNKIGMIITTFVAHFQKEVPSSLVNPNSNTPDDVNAADLSTSILKAEYTPKLEYTLEEYFYWKYIIGTGIRGLFWNPRASAPIKLPLYGGENGDEVIGHEIDEIDGVGQIYSKAVNPFNFYPVGGPDVKDCSEILYAEYQTLDEIKGEFDFEATADSSKGETRTGVYSRDYAENEFELFDKRAKVFQYWTKPTSDHKDGLYSIIINDEVIDINDNPYTKYSHPYPFFKSCSIPIPGKFWGKSPVEMLRKAQISYNYVYSILIQTLERMGKLQWWLTKGTKVDKTGVNSELGSINYYSAQPGQAPPSAVTPPQIPMYYFQILQALDKAFDDISGFHEVKSARLPKGANNPSGIMVNLLLEQDETRLTPAIKQYLRSVKQESKLYLEMVQDLYQEPRILKIGGAEKEALIQDFQGAQLQGNNDVEVELAPVLSDSRAAWEATVTKALEIGAIDPRTYIRKMKLEHPKTLKMIMAEEELVNRENTEMRQGKPRGVEEYYVDEIHLPIHEGFMKTKTYENLDDEIKGIFNEHRKEHQKQQAEKFKQQMNAQAQQAAAQNPQPQEAGVM